MPPLSHTLGNAVTTYRDTLQTCLQSQPPAAQQVLAVLNARDALHAALAQSSPPSPYLLSEIHDLDRLLQQQAKVLTTQLDFGDYRQSFPKSAEQWWWFLDASLETSHPYNWLFNGVATLAWAASIGLLIDISGRFLLGGAGVVGLSAVALSNLLALLQARNELTDAGSEGMRVFFDRFKVPATWRSPVRCGSATLLTAALFAFWLALPTISNGYNRRGQQDQSAGKLGSAEENYDRAIALNPDNMDAHYNLGTLYEDIQELDRAETQYLFAIRGDLPEAYNNLARLYLQPPDANLDKAAALLNLGLKLADEQQSHPEIKYSLYKNLGWALFQQEQYASAKSALTTAIALSQQPDAKPYVNNPGSAHCLLAQTLEARGESGTLPVWQRCCQLGNNGIPEENAWLRLARQRLETKGLDFNQSCRPTAPPLP